MASSEEHGAGSQRADASDALTLGDVTLLQPESVVEQRLASVKPLADLIRDVVAATAVVDARRQAPLPSYLHAVIVARASGTRVWLVGPNGDIAVPELDAEIAKLSRLPVRSGNIAVIAALTRPGASAVKIPMPSAWSTAASAGSADVDAVIDRVWPP